MKYTKSEAKSYLSCIRVFLATKEEYECVVKKLHDIGFTWWDPVGELVDFYPIVYTSCCHIFGASTEQDPNIKNTIPTQARIILDLDLSDNDEKLEKEAEAFANGCYCSALEELNDTGLGCPMLKEAYLRHKEFADMGEYADGDVSEKGESSNVEKMNLKFEFKPFDRVLVRSSETDAWEASLYSHYDEKFGLHCAGGRYWAHCVPYVEGLNTGLVGHVN